MTGLRYRIVTHQDGTDHVSSVVHTEDEAHESLDLEAHIHEATGWHVERLGEPLLYVTASNGRVTRRIFARSFTPTTDTEVSS